MMRYYFITSQSRWNIEICQRSCQGIRALICPTALEDNESVKSLRLEFVFRIENSVAQLTAVELRCLPIG
ncbi:hypothetical protein TNIN_241961 [Trichonephila inaurata madagascariensis]|uniref:Uncharacterized protein n=1 Tax=Trichonephila inaurata madagascariensis TaxID=2747483 RepID=A0A8X7C846_9ARAC|nr:hypothetical protein TNIN_241961 [Trichonephila inaurata madagascariensis]